MSSTTMHFGPEWMRPKHGSSRPAPSPPLTISPAPPGTSTYSALVTPATNPPAEKSDDTHPFRYTKDDMLRIYKEGGGKGGLGIEVERWEGIVREEASDPVGLKEMTDYEKKIFAGPLNSELRRRQSSDLLSPLTTSTFGERPKLGHSNSGPGSPMRERIGPFMGRRRGDSTGDQPPLNLPRKLSTSSLQAPLASPREAALPSPRTRIGYTPGFDGVLSESWSSRRKAAEALTKPSGGMATRPERNGNELHTEANGIQEEVEDQQSGSAKDPTREKSEPAQGANVQLEVDPGPVANGPPSQSPAIMSDLDGSVSNLALDDHTNKASNGVTPTSSESPATVPPPGSAALASVEWTYLDPQGQTQGPFRADVMQRWHDEGYFSVDLLMKRIHLDSDWTSVGDMVRQAGNNPIFLTPLHPAPTPPGLPRRPDPLLEGPAVERVQHSPYQPVPTRSLRSSTLESFLQNGSSNPESPSSSFGAGRFPTASPDPNLLDGRVLNQHLYNDIGAGHRVPGYQTNLEPMSHAIGQRRATYNEPFDPAFVRRPSYTQLNNGRAADGLAFTSVDGGNSVDSISQFSHDLIAPGADATSSSSGGFGINAMNAMRGPQEIGMVNGPSGFGSGNFGPIGGFSAASNTSRVVNRDGFILAPGEDRQDARQNLPFGSPYTNMYQGQQDIHSLNSFSSISNDRQLPMNQVPHSFIQSVQPSTQSPWLQQDHAGFRRPGPFDPVHPTASNTVPISHPSVVQGRATQPALSNDQSPWLPNAQNAIGAGWGHDSSSLTVANLGQHNQQHEGLLPIQTGPAERPPVKLEHGQNSQPAPLAAPVAEAAPVQEPTEEAARPAQKPRRKSAAQPSATQVVHSASAPAASAKPPSPLPSAEPKAAWAINDDGHKARPAGAPLNLREIQEAEARKLEARKTVERERERASRAAAASVSPPEEFQSFTATWGLPTSQAGTARTPASAKESPALSATAASSPNTPAWTNAAKAPIAKKSVKEIQEEEERRKKQALKEKETAAAAVRRAYAETTTRGVASPPVNVGGAWATVGANGKAGTVVAPVRPAVAPAAPAKTVPVSSAPVVPAASAARPTIASVARSSTSTSLKTTSQKVDDVPVAPSHDFLKWLSESLKGLNSSVSYEEISSMLLLFPIDADSSVMEIISDLIYANSTTMDGRRFATDFVNRRKADQASRTKGSAPASASAKPASIADVVKAQPKPAQSEWGFKVVNKKKKGGRS